MEKYNDLCETCKNHCKQLEIAIVVECPHYVHNGKRYIEKAPKHKPVHRELTGQEKAEIKKLVYQCANYDRQENQCLPLDGACYMLNKAYTGALCRRFERAVLPLSPRLEAALKGQVANTKPCGVCGRQFALAGRKTYCSDACAEKARKHADMLRARKYRRNKGESVTD